MRNFTEDQSSTEYADDSGGEGSEIDYLEFQDGLFAPVLTLSDLEEAANQDPDASELTIELSSEAGISGRFTIDPKAESITETVVLGDGVELMLQMPEVVLHDDAHLAQLGLLLDEGLVAAAFDDALNQGEVGEMVPVESYTIADDAATGELSTGESHQDGDGNV
ncbi:hypothetical protein ACQZV8_09865 [Magnetococcales bacterium HHB-1]